MNHRQRVLTTLRHQEPDRVPIDLGGTVDSTLSALSYQALRRELGLAPNVTRVQDVYQYTAVVDDDVRLALGADTHPVLDQPSAWREGTLPDGTPALFPDRFQPLPEPDGSWIVRDAAGIVTLKMPAAGYYFDPVHSPLAGADSIADVDRHLDAIAAYDRPDHLDLDYETLAEQARLLRQSTDYLLVGFFGGHIFQAAQALRGWEQFLVDLLVNRPLAEALLDRLAEANVARFAHYAATVGRYVDVIHFEDDLGMQDRPLLRPSLYRQVVKPYHARLFRFARERCDAFLLFHSDGAIAPLLPDLIDLGIDAIHPVQTSAAGMDLAVLKRDFGRDLTFWGAGCDSQSTLPFGTPEQVAAEARRAIDVLAPGGGYVLAAVHNIQAGVPAANVVALFQAAQTHGLYR